MMKVIVVWRGGKRRVDHLDLSLYLYVQTDWRQTPIEKNPPTIRRGDTHELLPCSLGGQDTCRCKLSGQDTGKRWSVCQETSLTESCGPLETPDLGTAKPRYESRCKRASSYNYRKRPSFPGFRSLLVCQRYMRCSTSYHDIEVEDIVVESIRWLLIVYDVRDLYSIHFPKGLRGGSDQAGVSWHFRNEMPSATTFA
jgi:hypothetical protein